MSSALSLDTAPFGDMAFGPVAPASAPIVIPYVSGKKINRLGDLSAAEYDELLGLSIRAHEAVAQDVDFLPRMKAYNSYMGYMEERMRADYIAQLDSHADRVAEALRDWGVPHEIEMGFRTIAGGELQYTPGWKPMIAVIACDKVYERDEQSKAVLVDEFWNFPSGQRTRLCPEIIGHLKPFMASESIDIDGGAPYPTSSYIKRVLEMAYQAMIARPKGFYANKLMPG